MKKIHIPTLVAISIIAWFLVNTLHEIAGHGGMAFISGLDVKAVNTTTVFVDVDWQTEIDNHGFLSLRLFLAGGVFMNFVGLIFGFLLLKYNQSLKPSFRVFLWLFASLNYVVIVMNLVSAPFTGGGDFAGIIRTLENQPLTRMIVLIFGLIWMILGYVFLQKAFMAKSGKAFRAKITFIPIVIIIIVQSLSLIKSPFAYLPPEQNHLLISVFAYFHLILWAVIVFFLPLPDYRNKLEQNITPRSVPWIVAATLIFMIYMLIIGPGIGSFDGHPSLL